MRRARIAAAISDEESAPTGIIKLPVASLRRPTAYGPTNPPRLPTALIQAIPAAAPERLNIAVGIAQNGPSVPQIPSAASESAARANTGVVETLHNRSPPAATSAGSATCQRR